VQKPLQITFRDMDTSDAVKAAVQDKAAELEKYSEHIISCHVVIERPHHHKAQGSLFHCRIDMTVPGHELVVGRNPDKHGAHEDVYVAIRDAFNAAKRELQGYERKRRNQVKHHEAPPHAIVAQLFPSESYGFLKSEDGREIYFHANSVIGGFDDLELGVEVRFAEEIGEKGPQASSVTPVGKSGHTL